MHMPERMVLAPDARIGCSTCTRRSLCLPLDLDATETARLDGLIRRRRSIPKGQTLFRVGDPLETLFAVRRGTFKTVRLCEDGRINVTGFFSAGELLGLDAIMENRHPCSAEALENSDVCEIPFGALEGLSGEIPRLQHQLFKLMSRELVRDEQLLTLLTRMTAEERVAWCLLSFSQRQSRAGISPIDISLPISRQDLGHYLGLALETVSRLFSRFQEEGLIEVNGRQVRLRDLSRLHAIAGTACL